MRTDKAKKQNHNIKYAVLLCAAAITAAAASVRMMPGAFLQTAYAADDKDAQVSYDISDYQVDYRATEVEAAEDLRKAMKERRETVSVGFIGTADHAELKRMIGDIFEKALEHTGKGDEGDYLRFQYSSYAGRAMTTYSNGQEAIIIAYVIRYNTDKDQEETVDSKAAEIIEELDLGGRDDYEKIKSIHDWLCANTEYDAEAAAADEVKEGSDTAEDEGSDDEADQSCRTAYGALADGKAVCQGYALAFYRLLLEAGIDNRIIPGEGKDSGDLSGPHMWNLVELDDRYYYVDATWDDNQTSRSYFLRGSGEFEESHIPADEYAGEAFAADHPVSDSDYKVSIMGKFAELADSVRSFAGKVSRLFRAA